MYNLRYQINKFNIKFFEGKNIHISWDAKESSGEAALFIIMKLFISINITMLKQKNTPSANRWR